MDMCHYKENLKDSTQVAARKPRYLGAQKELSEQPSIPSYRMDPFYTLGPVPGSPDQMPRKKKEQTEGQPTSTTAISVIAGGS